VANALSNADCDDFIVAFNDMLVGGCVPLFDLISLVSTPPYTYFSQTYTKIHALSCYSLAAPTM
jgi:hypothetical protein